MRKEIRRAGLNCPGYFASGFHLQLNQNKAIKKGTTMKQAQSQVYNRIKNILIPNMYYRTDIGDRWLEDSDKLHTWGYLRGV